MKVRASSACSRVTSSAELRDRLDRDVAQYQRRGEATNLLLAEPQRRCSRGPGRAVQAEGMVATSRSRKAAVSILERHREGLERQEKASPGADDRELRRGPPRDLLPCLVPEPDHPAGKEIWVRAVCLRPASRETRPPSRRLPRPVRFRAPSRHVTDSTGPSAASFCRPQRRAGSATPAAALPGGLRGLTRPRCWNANFTSLRMFCQRLRLMRACSWWKRAVRRRSSARLAGSCSGSAPAALAMACNDERRFRRCVSDRLSSAAIRPITVARLGTSGRGRTCVLRCGLLVHRGSREAPCQVVGTAHRGHDGIREGEAGHWRTFGNTLPRKQHQLTG